MDLEVPCKSYITSNLPLVSLISSHIKELESYGISAACLSGDAVNFLLLNKLHFPLPSTAGLHLHTRQRLMTPVDAF